jgi:O-antigen ligase
VWDMVLGNGTWFSLRTAQYQALPVRVVDRSRGKGTQVAVKLPNPADPTELPTASPPDREHIWSVVLRMIQAHPLFGTGPRGVWLNYVAFAKTRWSIYGAHAPGHAHSLYLELFADFGLVGGSLFLAWFIVVWWPLILGTWQGQTLSSWQVGLMGATGMFLGNGLVDYTLQSLSLLTMFWLIGGLSTALAKPQRGNDS